MLEQQSILALLQTFEVTARHLSFTLAAHEMNLTQGAVSHRIRRLVALCENEAPSPFGYDLICPQENRSRPRFRAFSEWLAEECA